MNIRFAEPCRELPLELFDVEFRIFRQSVDASPCHECEQDIYLGFFFDGTNSNKFRDTPNFAHSNVARLYEAFIGSPGGQTPPTLRPAVINREKVKRSIFADSKFEPRGFPAEEFPYYRKVYVPGVGTPFREEEDGGVFLSDRRAR